MNFKYFSRRSIMPHKYTVSCGVPYFAFRNDKHNPQRAAGTHRAIGASLLPTGKNIVSSLLCRVIFLPEKRILSKNVVNAREGLAYNKSLAYAF